jgi:hypothetical protein
MSTRAHAAVDPSKTRSINPHTVTAGTPCVRGSYSTPGPQTSNSSSRSPTPSDTRRAAALTNIESADRRGAASPDLSLRSEVARSRSR